MLEGHPNWYRRKQIPIKVKDTIVMAWIYFNPTKITPTTTFHKAYKQTPVKPKKYAYYDYGGYERYTYADKVEYTPEWRKSPYIGDVLTNDETIIKDDDIVKPLDEMNLFSFGEDFQEKKYHCLHCANEVEYDNYSSYRCSGCGAWFTEDELDVNTF